MNKHQPDPNTLIIKDALFPHSHAQALWPTLQQQAPYLCSWLEQSRGQLQPHDPVRQRCTALEQVLLQKTGFEAQDQQTASAGMALILALQAGFWQQVPAGQAFWLAELVHISPGREGASLLPARALSITAEESAALYDSLLPYISDTPFRFQPLCPQYWQVLTEELLPQTLPTTELLFESTVQDWWDTSQSGRAWRQWANEVQMLWYDHPVNQRRQAKQQPTINGLWLMGGASKEQLRLAAKTPSAPLPLPTIMNQLEPSFKEQDWQQWLTEIQTLDAEIAKMAPQQIIFTGTEGYLVTESAQRRPFWKKLFSSPTTGQQCWLNPF